MILPGLQERPEGLTDRPQKDLCLTANSGAVVLLSVSSLLLGGPLLLLPRFSFSACVLTAAFADEFWHAKELKWLCFKCEAHPMLISVPRTLLSSVLRFV